MEFVTVIFTCHTCGIQRLRCPVIARKEGEDIKQWMDAVAFQVQKRHLQLSPHCTAKTCDLAIPLPKEIKKSTLIVATAPDLSNNPQLSEDFMKSRAAN